MAETTSVSSFLDLYAVFLPFWNPLPGIRRARVSFPGERRAPGVPAYHIHLVPGLLCRMRRDYAPWASSATKTIGRSMTTWAIITNTRFLRHQYSDVNAAPNGITTPTM